MSEANKDLLRGATVTEVAFHYGYQSVDGFTRAFKRWSGFLPSDVIRKGLSKSFPRISFVITVKGGNSMEFRIEEKPAFHLVGVSKRVPIQFEGVNQEIVKLAESITDEQRKAMRSLQNIEPYEIINASYNADANFIKEEGDLTHMIGVLTTETDVSPLLEKVPVEACTWAIFPNEGPFPSTLQETMAKTYSEWLPSSDYELIHAPTFSFTKMDEHQRIMRTVKFGSLFGGNNSKEQRSRDTRKARFSTLPSEGHYLCVAPIRYPYIHLLLYTLTWF